MLIKTTSGYELGGSATSLHPGKAYNFKAGDTACVSMQFERLSAPGVYFLNAGASARKNGEHLVLHRILDFLAFRVASNRPAPFSGVIDFRIKPSACLMNTAS